MESKIILNYTPSCSDLSVYDGFYVNSLEHNLSLFIGKELFFDVRSLSANDIISASTQLSGQNATFIVDSIMQVAFIKSVNPSANISFYYEKYSPNVLPFLITNGFEVTFNYPTLAPERVNEMHSAGIKVNAVFLSKKDEVGVLKYYNVDYITVNDSLK
ncbi:MAG: hypothetical protein IKL82_05020 [Clostridia bacterium]|nr:hypothetical protein [Clostridia bacterium]